MCLHRLTLQDRPTWKFVLHRWRWLRSRAHRMRRSRGCCKPETATREECWAPQVCACYVHWDDKTCFSKSRPAVWIALVHPTSSLCRGSLQKLVGRMCQCSAEPEVLLATCVELSKVSVGCMHATPLYTKKVVRNRIWLFICSSWST